MSQDDTTLITIGLMFVSIGVALTIISPYAGFPMMLVGIVLLGVQVGRQRRDQA